MFTEYAEIIKGIIYIISGLVFITFPIWFYILIRSQKFWDKIDELIEEVKEIKEFLKRG